MVGYGFGFGMSKVAVHTCLATFPFVVCLLVGCGVVSCSLFSDCVACVFVFLCGPMGLTWLLFGLVLVVCGKGCGLKAFGQIPL